MSRAIEETNRRMLRARDAMDRAYGQQRLDIAELATIAHVSEAHFIRTFRATFGETPLRYLQRRRVERSMFLPRETHRMSRRAANMGPCSLQSRNHAITLSQIFVLDQDEALEFYVGKLGLEVGTDVDLGFMRCGLHQVWL